MGRAVLVAISIPIFTSQLEKSREAVDAANIRAGYAELMSDVLTGDYKTGDGAKIPTENPSTNYRIPMHFFQAVSQNQRRPFRRNLPGAKTEINPTSQTPPASRYSQRDGA